MGEEQGVSRGRMAKRARYPFALSLPFDLFRGLSAGLLSTTCSSLFNAGLTVGGRRIQRELSIQLGFLCLYFLVISYVEMREARLRGVRSPAVPPSSSVPVGL